MESDDLLFPIDEVVETAAPAENVKCEKGNTLDLLVALPGGTP